MPSKSASTRIKHLVAVVLTGWMMLHPQSGWAGDTLTIGGGSPAGIYQVFAATACALVNESLDGKRSCKARSTLGSVYNIRAVVRRIVEFGIAQSDQHYKAWHGTDNWKGGPQANLRSVFSIHYEYAYLVVRADRSITALDDLKGLTVNLGNPGSGHRAMAEDLFRLHGLDWRRDVTLKALPQADASTALITGEIDAFFYSVGLGAEAIQRPARAVGINLLPLDTQALRAHVETHPYYFMTSIPSGIYAGVDRDVPTYAVKETLVTAAETDDDLVYDLTRTVFENLDRIRAAHPAFSQLTETNMLEGQIAPFHPGALRYYRERGWK